MHHLVNLFPLIKSILVETINKENSVKTFPYQVLLAVVINMLLSCGDVLSFMPLTIFF